ncbi:MAG TPA: hypothetical protein PKZ76_14955 [Xanthomonadaceae bacterium]|nr:hypothetical protein [Xanthomonadaceae bacterium]
MDHDEHVHRVGAALQPLLHHGMRLLANVAGILSIVVPGFVAGYLTTSKPMLVGIAGAIANYVLGLLTVFFMFGGFPLGLLLFDIAGDVAQAAITIGTCVATYALRRRLAERDLANVN